MPKYFCQRRKIATITEGVNERETHGLAMINLGCYSKCKSSIYLLRGNPKLYNLMQFSDKYCHGPAKITDK